MSRSDTAQEREAQIRAAMAEFGVTRQHATFMVAVGRGERDGDIVAPALTTEERRQRGLDLAPHDEATPRRRPARKAG